MENKLLADTNDSLNEVDSKAGEHELDDGLRDQYSPVNDVDDRDETAVDIASEVLFAQQILESFVGEDEVLAKNLKNEVLKNMSASGWEDVEEPDVYEHLKAPYEPVDDTASYPGLRQGYSGPSAEALRHGESPVALFFYLIPVTLWQ
ncbi:hypothetical protein L917_03910 [Phytophthora nicotianae]|uniref:Uncharacterized protein n=2 Tax=Phytophthora nicotianae TaxID=4792 RepID=V9FPJ7_PHYNI|nr:hypothetical protein F443_04190 [Phytophthora nicotianae P1569]ETL99171.1 hypothetical protein L917_03910 [Phytophthora nicotianae]ETM52350.1 hypothetical protein L914_04019 [Phytophthora nicotianae]